MHARALLLPALLAPALAALTGCPAGAADVRPPDDGFYFPTGLAMSPDEQFLFVSNANSDLRFGSSSLQVIDLDVVDQLVRGWVDDVQVPSGCTQDLDQRQTVICPEEHEDNNSRYLLADASVRMGNFVGEVVLQELMDGRYRLFVPARGDPSINWIDFDPADGLLECGGSGSYPRCDSRHQLTALRNDPDLRKLTEEPFGMYVDSGNGYVIVTHLTTGNITLTDSPPDASDDPLLVDVKGGFFAQSTATGLRGAVAAAGREPGNPLDLVYVTSRAEARVQMIHVEQPEGAYPLIVPTDYFFLNAVFPAQESRGLAFSADGNRAHVINRRPPALITVDTALDATGRPRNEVLQATELCPQAGLVTVADLGEGDRAYVSCFRDGQVWVIDPEAATIESVINVGRGPHVMAIAKSRKLMYVTNFLENTIAVIDLTPGAPSEHRVVVRLGEPDFGDE
jgi:hypothetical protein